MMQTQTKPQTLASVAAALNGRVVGDGTLPARTVVHPSFVSGPEDLVLAIEEAEFALLPKSGARIAVVSQRATIPEGLLAGYIAVGASRRTILVLTELFDKPLHAWPGVHPSAVVEPGARIGQNVSLGPFVYVGPDAAVGDGTVVMAQATIGAGATVGRNCLIHSGVRIGERVSIGNRVILHMNAVIGSDGFSFVTPEIGSVETAKSSGQIEAFNVKIERVASIGTVVIHDDVEIGACSTIDRATIAATSIGPGTKIDNLVTIGHNNIIGANCLLAGQTGVAGSCEIGDGVVTGGQVGIADHLKIGDNAIITAGAGVARDVKPKAIMYGLPALPRDEFGEKHLNTGRLTRYYRKIDELERKLGALEAMLAAAK